MKKHKAIKILDEVKTADGWQFAMAVDGTTFSVTSTNSYHQQLTAGKVAPAKLVEASLRYLLDREPVESILSEFDLGQIELYFPNYQSEIQRYLK